jgi:hypothetical protein
MLHEEKLPSWHCFCNILVEKSIHLGATLGVPCGINPASLYLKLKRTPLVSGDAYSLLKYGRWAD